MNIAVIFGGRSCEHNISIATGVQAANALLSTGNKIICIYITREGVWKSGGDFFALTLVNSIDFCSANGYTVSTNTLFRRKHHGRIGAHAAHRRQGTRL